MFVLVFGALYSQLNNSQLKSYLLPCWWRRTLGDRECHSRSYYLLTVQRQVSLFSAIGINALALNVALSATLRQKRINSN